MKLKLSFSLLALNNLKKIEQLFKILHYEKINFIEIPPLKFFPKYNFSKKRVNKFKKLLNKYKIKISSVQAIFYKTNLNIFEINDEKKVLYHLKKIILFCDKLKIKNIIFGSPVNRVKKNINIDCANRIFAHILNKLSIELKTKKINFCIEPNAKIYKCDYINNSQEAVKFIKRYRLSNIYINFDTGNALLERDYAKVSKNDLRYFKNFQVSEKNLGALKKDFKKHIKLLKKHQLNNKYLSLEMVNIDIDQIQKNIKKFKIIASNIK